MSGTGRGGPGPEPGPGAGARSRLCPESQPGLPSLQPGPRRPPREPRARRSPAGGARGEAAGPWRSRRKVTGPRGLGGGRRGSAPGFLGQPRAQGQGSHSPPPGSFLGSHRSLQPRGAEVPTAAPWQPPALQRLLEPPVPPAGPSPAPSGLGVLSCCLPQPGLVSPMVLRRDGADAAVAVVLVAVLTPSFPLSGSPVDRCQHRRG